MTDGSVGRQYTRQPRLFLGPVDASLDRVGAPRKARSDARLGKTQYLHSIRAWTRQVVQPEAPGAICRAFTGAITIAVWWSVQPQGTVTMWVYLRSFAGDHCNGRPSASLDNDLVSYLYRRLPQVLIGALFRLCALARYLLSPSTPPEILSLSHDPFQLCRRCVSLPPIYPASPLR